MRIDIGDVRDVVPFALEEADRVVFPAPEKITGAVEADTVRIRRVRRSKDTLRAGASRLLKA
jgi:hypothetical protein